MKDPQAIYRQFIDFEEQAASIYLKMASRFSPEKPDLAAFWLEMGIQEKQHAGLLQFCAAEGLFALELPTEEDTQKVRDLFEKLARKAAEPALTVEEAFDLATELEESEVNEIYHRLTTPLHESMYLLRRKIATSIPDHAEFLRREAAKYFDPDKTSERLRG